MTPTLSRALLAAVVIAGALLVWTERSAHREQTEAIDQLRQELTALRAAPPPQANAPSAAPTIVTVQLTGEQLDRVGRQLAEQLKGLAPATSPIAARDEKPAPPPPPTPAQQQAIAQATAVLDQALRTGKLRREDVLELRRLRVESGNAEAFRELAQRIVVAVNQDKLVPESPELLFP